MRSRRRPITLGPPGVTGAARIGVPVSQLSRGDVAVLDRTDLDLATARALVDTGVLAVLNVSRLMGGRYASLGPGVLADADVVWLDGVGSPAVSRIEEGALVRVLAGEVLTPDGRVLARGHPVDLHRVRSDAATGPGHGSLPELRVRVTGRPALVVGVAVHADLRRVAAFVRAQGPVVVAVGRPAVEDLVGLAWPPDLVVLPHDGEVEDAVAPTSADLGLGAGADVVVTEDEPDDVATLLMGRDGATVVVTMGLVVSDATRARLGARLVDSAALWLLAAAPARSRRGRIGAVAAGAVAVGLAALTVALPDWLDWSDWWGRVADLVGSLT